MPKALPAITDDLIADLAQTPGMVRSGQDYARQGRVADIEIDADLGMVSAAVRGSGRNVYIATLFWTEADLGLDSECTCPVGFGCKHAVALACVLRDRAPETPRLIIAAAPPEQAMAAEVGQWLAQIEAERMADSRLVQPVCFVIEPKRVNKAPKRAKGAKSQPDPTRHRILATLRAFRQRAPDDWVPLHTWEIAQSRLNLAPEALRLLARMTPVAAGGDFSTDKVPQGRYGWQWLAEAAGLGLLHWKSPAGPALTVAPDNLSVRFAWRWLDDGSQFLDLEGLPIGTHVAVGDPPLAIDETAATITLIDTGLPLPQAGRLLAMPPIAPADIAAIAARWGVIAGDAIPAPMPPTRVEIAQRPRPVLRFLVEKLDMRERSRNWYANSWRTTPCKLMRLAFDYGEHRLTAPVSAGEVIVRGADGPVCLIRALDAEQAAADRLADLGLVALTLVDDVRLKPAQAWDHGLTKTGGSYPAFLANAAATLEAEGWRIEYADDWPHRLAPREETALGLTLGPADGAAARGQTGDAIDWFDLELPALVAGARIDILPALRAMLADAGEAMLALGDDYLIAVPIDATRFTTVPLGTVRPLLAALLRLALAERNAATLRVNRYDLGAIHELGGDGVNWTSGDALRRLASALHDPAQADFVPPMGLTADLRAYQRTGVAWLHALHLAGLGGILADDMGLGKTLQAITHLIGKAPALVVAPTSVLPNWQAELARFAPGLRCHVWHGQARREGAAAMVEAGVVLTSYPLLARDKDILADRAWALVVLDEAHVLKNPATVGFKAAAALRSAQTIALTGTPVENRLNDIWALASLTNPGLLGSFDTFRKAYRTPIEKHGDATARQALARRLRPFLLRRTKDEVASELPRKTLISERIALTDGQLRLYESQRLLMQTRVREEIARVGLMRAQIIVLDAMLKLRQICCDPGLLPGGAGEGVASAKRERLLEMVTELAGEGRRVIVFSQFTAMLDRISADLSVAGLLHAQLRGTTRDRAAPVRQFQSGEVPVILVSLKAGGAGVNLTAADTVILYDPWWNPAVEAQAIDRAHRIGQTKPVFVHRLIAMNTIEDKILALQARKQDLADLLWREGGDAGASGRALDDADIAFLLGGPG
ncbi:DEAD/DEAH box helicase [Novosphingobium sp. B-7]|uniref:DEAD/DEAH box helicase n=1 Tax=Novosphingobium sp. B-7 TaxID=1298855 RepID=UPI0003B4EE97|nr:DEAD/DEAH box helicase [Novosphingobium sp. B-7]